MDEELSETSSTSSSALLDGEIESDEDVDGNNEVNSIPTPYIEHSSSSFASSTSSPLLSCFAPSKLLDGECVRTTQCRRCNAYLEVDGAALSLRSPLLEFVHAKVCIFVLSIH